MNKVLIGLIVGAVLGVVDGATAWFTPEVRSQMLGIIIGSTFKGIIAGVAAGWFARKVRSVPKGIAFGFAVGLLLAFLVALSPQPSGNHYWVEIMLPGSILGGVIGWATQRYGRPGSSPGAATAALMLALVLLGMPLRADEHEGSDHHAVKPSSNASFERLKTLAGTWTANIMTPDGAATTVEYRVTAGGSVVMQTMFAGTPDEMINMYTVDGDAVMATHYCSGRNQPLLRLDPSKSTANELVFGFVKVSGANLDHYINGVQIRFGDDGKAVEEWSSNGQEGPMLLYLNGRK